MSRSVLHPTLYTPATTALDKLINLVNRRGKAVNLAAYRIVMCTEDSIREDDVPEALRRLETVLEGMEPESKVTSYVRVRNPELLARVMEMPFAERLRGFVIPKTDPASFPQYADQLQGTGFRLMPILESPLTMDRHFRETLRMVLTSDGYRGMIDCLRIGANDLMGHLGIRRDDNTFTVYDTPVGNVIHDIINEFRGLAGFTVTAPVFECFAPRYDELLRKEVRHNMMNGLYGQTVIHPRHIRIIRDMYKVSETDLASATEIVQKDTAVKGVNGKMDERATHLKWAELVLERDQLFGDGETSQTHLDAIR